MKMKVSVKAAYMFLWS